MQSESIPAIQTPSPWLAARVVATTLTVIIGAQCGLGLPEPACNVLAVEAIVAHVALEGLLALLRLGRRIEGFRRQIESSKLNQAVVPAAKTSAK